MNGFEVQDIPGKGRGIVATKSFQIGDVVLEEEPFVSHQYSWNVAYGYNACNHCLRPLETIEENVRRLANNPKIEVPLLEHDPTRKWIQQFRHCPDCKIEYCSEDCRLEALNKYHKAACLGSAREDETHPVNILNEVWKHMHYPPETGTIMLIVRIMAMFKQSTNKDKFLNDLKSFCSEMVNKEKNIYHKMLGANFESQMSNLYTAFKNVYQDEDFSTFSSPEGFKTLLGIIGLNCQGIATSPLAQWVKKVLSLNLAEPQKSELDAFIDQLYAKVADFAGDFLNAEGSGLYLLQSKLNHSCSPNAQSTFPYSNDIIVVKVIKPIEPGQEICISYLDECILSRSRHTRQRILRESYLFICTCVLCEEQAPTDNGVSSEDESEEDMSVGYEENGDAEM